MGQLGSLDSLSSGLGGAASLCLDRRLSGSANHATSLSKMSHASGIAGPQRVPGFMSVFALLHAT